MFEKSLKEKFSKIFEIDKVTYDRPSDANEQECLWVNLEDSTNRVRKGEFTAVVRGTAYVMGQSTKIPFGFISKKIQEADHTDTKDLFFSEIDKNTQVYQNIVQRSFAFVYFFHGQYDPKVGTINTIDFKE